MLTLSKIQRSPQFTKCQLLAHPFVEVLKQSGKCIVKMAIPAPPNIPCNTKCLFLQSLVMSPVPARRLGLSLKYYKTLTALECKFILVEG